MSARTFTDRQGQYLAFIDAYPRVTGRPPAESDIQRRFGVSPPSVHQMVLTLERLGLIRRRGGRAASRCSSPPSTCPCYATQNPSNPLCRGTRATWPQVECPPWLEQRTIIGTRERLWLTRSRRLRP